MHHSKVLNVTTWHVVIDTISELAADLICPTLHNPPTLLPSSHHLYVYD